MYIYHYVDYLDNVRVIYYNSANVTTILEENNYYPFGSRQRDGSPENLYNAGEQGYSYKYNGKELQTDSGMLDYGARFYMPEIGRWSTVDPLAEMYSNQSPYHYAMNNPMMFIDPDGRLSQSFIDNLWNSASGTTWYNTGAGFTSNGGDSMDFDGHKINWSQSYTQQVTSSIVGGTGDGGFMKVPLNDFVQSISQNYKLDGKPDVSKDGISNMINLVPELKRLFKLSGELAQFTTQMWIFDEDRNGSYGVTTANLIKFSIVANSTNLILAYTIGHELIHVYHNLKILKEIRAGAKDSWRGGMNISEVEAYSWEIDMGNTKNGIYGRDLYLDKLLKIYKIDYKPKHLY